MNELNIYMGYDLRERKAYSVARNSIIRHSSNPKTYVRPVALDDLKDRGILTRPIERRDGKLWCPISQAPMATEFAISRFAVPFMAKTGWALFVDCDILCMADISELFALADERYAVMVVKHNHAPTETTKMDGQQQTAYPRKNWSSVVLWNCDHPGNQRLTLKELNEWPGRDLHAFKWLKDEEIGGINYAWNCLVGINDHDAVRVGILHYTNGGPWLKDWKGGPLDELWNAEAEIVFR